MDDEQAPHDVDRRIRAALAIDDVVSRRVLGGALNAPIRPPSRGRRVMSGVAVTCGICLVVATGLWRWWRNPPPPAQPAALRMTAEGAVLVVESPDGRRWVVGPPPARRTGGNYVLVLR